MQFPTAPWQIWIDTGGTFTDAIGIAPDGSIQRAKVLSSSALRGTILSQPTPRSLMTAVHWNAPSDFIRGIPLFVPGVMPHPVAVERFDSQTGEITLAAPLPANVPPGAPFEVRFPEEAPVVACRLLTGTGAGQSLPPLSLRLATTRGTNALLTRTGIPPSFFVTAGFADLIAIGTQQRPDLFALDIQKRAPLYGPVIEVEERLDAAGNVLRPLNEDRVFHQARERIASGITTAAVALLHSHRNPDHERRVASLLRDAGFTHISLSSELSPFIKALPRVETAVVNAYLAPVIDAYLHGVTDALPSNTTVHVMTSAGGLVRAGAFRPKDSLLSGPAGGIVGAALSGARAGFDRVIAFDMGGTSTDVARFDGAFDYVWEHTIGDAHLVAPALAIESVAAGGGTICFGGPDGVRVGPESAGASPGPACYGAGGPLTITDINLLLGRILPDRFEIPLIPDHADAAARAVIARLEGAPEQVIEADTRDRWLEGFLEIANERMADAIRQVSIRRGYAPSDYALLSFGGAGGQHACAVAERLGICTVVVPPDASLLSAWGIGHAGIERIAERQLLRRVDATADSEIRALVDQLSREAMDAVRDEGGDAPEISVHRRIVTVRLLGQETTQTIDFDPSIPLAEAFARRFQAVFGYPPPAGRPLEVDTVRIIAGSRPPQPDSARGEKGPGAVSSLVKSVWGRFGREWQAVPAYERADLSLDSEIAGPCLIVERHSVTVAETGWTCRIHSSGSLILTADRQSPPSRVARQRPDVHPNAIATELFAARFTAIAEEMGEQIRQNSISTNVKERLDYSCAVLDAEGALITAAAHIPVHLGALGACVRKVMAVTDLRPGDAIVTNHPAFGGSHLPDVTLITPVFDDAGERIGFVANRAHHAEIGGTRPGSMPPDATTLIEEGVVIPPFRMIENSVSRLDVLCDLLASAPYPTRSLADNRADLEAAIAANHRGASSLTELARTYGTATVTQHMTAITRRSEQLVRAALAAVPDGTYQAIETLDDGAPIAVAITIDGETATVDFTGTDATHPGNRNAPPAVALSAVLYVLRLLIGEPVPLNEGLLCPITLILPPDTLVNPTFDPIDPSRCPAVVGGNVETSQRIVDTLLKALGLCAASQGTMNNTLWGTDAFGYYETVCGGAGATPHAPGASGVHTHMTNTRITDVEVIEHRYPVRIERFARRHGSGGAGRHQGGDGVIRETVFLAPMALSMLTERRQSGPYGMAGGSNGLPGKQTLIRADGSIIELASTDGTEVQPGDTLILETPGGGGWGS